MPSHVFFTAPHRVMFVAGVAQLLLAFALWSVELLLRAGGGGVTLFPVLSSALWHPLLMVFAFFPFLIFGFLMTALPKWVGASALSPSAYLPACGAMNAGWLLFYLGTTAGWPTLAGLGLELTALGWLLAGRSLRLAARVDNPDKRHAWTAIALVFGGAALLAAAGLGLLLDRPELLRAATILGLWDFVVPVFVVVVHRMLPFFSQGVIAAGAPFRPMWMLWTLLACLAVHGIDAAFGHFLGLAWLADALAAAIALTLTWRWRLRESFRNRLLATHHVAFAWLGIGLAAFAVQGVLAAFGVDWGRQAPLHALTTGFLLSMVFGMATRVTLGHSGLPIAAAGWVWRAFWGLQAAVGLRLLADLGPPAASGWLLAGSALGMLGVFTLWGWRHLALFFRPRADGQPG